MMSHNSKETKRKFSNPVDSHEKKSSVENRHKPGTRLS